MKLSLTLKADTVNVLALNMGRISVDIDGIELASLIDAVRENGYSLRVADEPEIQVTEEQLPGVTRLKGIQCSNSDWVLYTAYGWLLRLNARLYPVLEFNEWGYQKPVVAWW